MRKLLLLIFVLTSLFIGSCQKAQETTRSKIDTAISAKIEDGTIELPKLIVQEKLSYYFAPLLVSTFASIVLIFSGMRKMGIAILIASIATITLLITLTLYIKALALTGLGILLVATYYIFRHLRDQKRHQLDMVMSVETAKTLIPEEHIGILKGSLLELQSKFTQDKVKKVKESINK